MAVKIPYDPVATEAMIQGMPVVKYGENKVGQQIKLLWQEVLHNLQNS